MSIFGVLGLSATCEVSVQNIPLRQRELDSRGSVFEGHRARLLILRHGITSSHWCIGRAALLGFAAVDEVSFDEVTVEKGSLTHEVAPSTGARPKLSASFMVPPAVMTATGGFFSGDILLSVG